MINTVIRCPNNMVIVFDEQGEQITDYQDHYHKVRASILRDAPAKAVFGHFIDFRPELLEVPREEW